MTLEAETVIVGGGVTGAAVAFFLTRAGASNLLIVERQGLASGATGICPGGIRQQFQGEADCRMARHSMSFWRDINSILEPEQPFEFERSGYLFLADSEDLYAQFRDNVALQNRLGISSQILAPGEVARLLPKLRLDGVVGASWCAEDGFLEDCHGVTSLLAQRSVDRGARLHFDEALSLEPESSGWRVVSKNAEVKCENLVLAAGVDTPKLASTFGLKLPIRAVRRRLGFTEPAQERLLPPLLAAPERGFAGKQLSYGVFYFGWLRETGQEDDLEYLEKGLSAGSTLLPPLAELPVRRILAGFYDQTPDSRPILGSVPDWPNLHLAAGFSGHGFMIAPAVGEALAASIRGKTPALPLEPFSIERFRSAQPAGHEGLTI